ncbi:transcriptional regulator, DeoR family [Paenibacillus sp. UNCCL117]|uniref:DeoR/GlpR family DNA-binding transcription regulator n=1 Tax=unclassified Paenibacillus TaxID=185978 RepID=UPI00089129A8|nr:MULTISPECIES: DeoR/GlpR family DNA-binding transcription regulator [unclassified Paenibacillus]SDC15060.1 DNA-binding transcriptional regulator of sugar metabolism, DeoR/GlpR family [Paenibacillus sp. cl123]SFW17461.1 transcriptional regulator, DeoR family [Paenibacillus sp. UNCCL117]
MLVAERYEMIVQLVNERGSIRVSELSELCGVTEETIRRDLDRLEAAGRLRRSHGGAVSVKETQAEIPYFEREIMHADEKRRIAQEAIQWIQPHDRVLLDASSTAWYMASYLPDIPLTVLTNSVKVISELSGKEKIEVISTGGRLAKRSLSFIGPLAERSLDAYHVDKLFLSCKGVHLERGISESNEQQALVKQKMVGIAEQVILLADASKFGVRSFTHVAELGVVDAIITDRGVSEQTVAGLQDRGMRVSVV